MIEKICVLVVLGMLVLMIVPATAFAVSWDLGGNFVTKNEQLGTTNSYDVEFITGGAVEMVLTSGGDLNVDSGTLFVDDSANNVGIGTTLPIAKLEVIEGVGYTGAPVGYFGTDTTQKIALVGDSSPTSSITLPSSKSIGVYGQGDDYGGYFVGKGYFSDFVGIGVLVPGAALDIGGGTGTLANGADDVLIKGDLEVDDDVLINDYLEVDGNVIIDGGSITTSVATSWNLFNPSTASLNIESGLLNFDTHNSRIGIGTVNPSEKLEVDGNIKLTGGNNWVGISSTQGVYIKNDGNIGIGTGNPSSKLHVSSGTDGDAELILEADIDNGNDHNNPFITFKQDANAVNAFIAMEGYAGERSGGTLADAFIIGSEDNDPAVQFVTDDNVRMTISTNGNIGIGISNPSSKLQVSSTDGDTELILEADTDNGNENDNPFITFKQDANAVNAFIAMEGDPGERSLGTLVNAFVIGSEDYDPAVQFVTNDIVRMTIQIDGEVGIGTTNPGSKLEIKGVGSTSTTSSLEVTDNGGTSLLYVRDDGRIGIGETSPSAKLDVAGVTTSSNALRIRAGDTYSTSGGGNQILFSYNGGTTLTHAIRTRHRNGVPDDNAIDFYVWTSGDVNSIGSTHSMSLVNGKVGIGTKNPGAKLDVRGSVVFNEDMEDYDFRIESDSDANIFFVDAENDKIGIGTANPEEELSIQGDVLIGSSSWMATGTTADLAIEGKVGIGIKSPGKMLEIRDNNEQLRLSYDATYYTDFHTRSNGNLWINPSGGKVGINAIPSTHTLEAGGDTKIHGNLEIRAGDHFYLGPVDTDTSWRIR
jgi:hypothetical protein